MGQLCEEMTSAELTHWMAYHRVRPIGEEGDDYRAAVQAAASLAAFGAKVTPADCLADWWGERKERRDRHLTVAESVAWAAAVAGKKG